MRWRRNTLGGDHQDRKWHNWTVEIAAPPQQRSFQEHCLAACRMREALSRRRTARRVDQEARGLDHALERMRCMGLLRDHGKVTVRLQRKGEDAGCFELVLPDKRSTNIPYETMVRIAYSSVRSCSDCSRTFGVHPDTVTRTRRLVAHCAELSDDQILSDIAASFRQDPPLFYCMALCADATAERLNMPMAGLEKMPHLTRSAWHVLVSTQRHSWCKQTADGTFKWTAADYQRPNLPLVATEKAGILFETLFDLPQIKKHTELVEEGLNSSQIATFVHFDLDGHSANLRMVLAFYNSMKPGSKRRLLLTTNHCSNHCQNLVDLAVVDCVDEGFAVTGSLKETRCSVCSARARILPSERSGAVGRMLRRRLHRR